MDLLDQALAVGMSLGEAQRALSWVDGMLSRNLRPRQRERFLKSKEYLERVISNERQNQARGLLSQLMQRRSPGLFMGERLTGGPRSIPGAEGSGVVIQPEETLSTWIRDFIPNTSWRDPMIMSPDRPREWRYGV